MAQYDESDFTFLHRLAAQYGEWFYHDGKTLHLSRPVAEARPLVSDGVRAGFQLSLTLRHGAFVVSQYNRNMRQQLDDLDGLARRENWKPERMRK